jgi:DNA replication licensing factor MCM2
LTDADVAGYSLLEFILMDNYRRRIARDYREFLTTFIDENGHSVYNAKIQELCAGNSSLLLLLQQTRKV